MPKLKQVFLWLLACMFLGMGVLHFVKADVMVAMMPPFFPSPRLLVYVSGIFEILGGIGILFPFSRRFSGWGLLALLVAVYPVNIYMAIKQISPPGMKMSATQLYFRLPMQFVFMAWVYWTCLKTPSLGELDK